VIAVLLVSVGDWQKGSWIVCWDWLFTSWHASGHRQSCKLQV